MLVEMNTLNDPFGMTILSLTGAISQGILAPGEPLGK